MELTNNTTRSQAYNYQNTLAGATNKTLDQSFEYTSIKGTTALVVEDKFINYLNNILKTSNLNPQQVSYIQGLMVPGKLMDPQILPYLNNLANTANRNINPVDNSITNIPITTVNSPNDLYKMYTELTGQTTSKPVSDTLTTEGETSTGLYEDIQKGFQGFLDFLRSLPEFLNSLLESLGLGKSTNAPKSIEDLETQLLNQYGPQADELTLGAETEANVAAFTLGLIQSFPPGSPAASDLAYSTFTSVGRIQSIVSSLSSMPQIGFIPDNLTRAQTALTQAAGTASSAASYAGVSFRDINSSTSSIAIA